MEKVPQTIRASSNKQKSTFYEGSSLSSSDFFFIETTSDAQFRICKIILCPECRSAGDVDNDGDNDNGEDDGSVDDVGNDNDDDNDGG